MWIPKNLVPPKTNIFMCAPSLSVQLAVPVVFGWDNYIILPLINIPCTFCCLSAVTALLAGIMVIGCGATVLADEEIIEYCEELGYTFWWYLRTRDLMKLLFGWRRHSWHGTHSSVYWRTEKIRTGRYGNAEDEAIKHCVVEYRLLMNEKDTIDSLYVDYTDGSDNDRYIIRDMAV